MGLTARLWSMALGGREVGIVIADPPKDQQEESLGCTISLSDQRPSAGKKLAYIKMLEPKERKMAKRWERKVTDLVNAEDQQLQMACDALAQRIGLNGNLQAQASVVV